MNGEASRPRRAEDAGERDVDSPCPREVWREALKGRRVSVTIQPDRTPNANPVTYEGRIKGRWKTGDPWNCVVTVQFVPDGDLAPVEIEAEKRGGTWDPFHAHHWKQTVDARAEMVTGGHAYQYVGRVEDIHIPESDGGV